VNYGPAARKYVWCALFVVLFTLFADAQLNRYIATAERQAVTDAEWDRILFFGQIKWALLFLDALMVAFPLFLTPSILLVGAVILAASSLTAFVRMAAPSGLFVSYRVIGIFFAFAGINILLLFQPQLLYEKWSLPRTKTEEPTPTISDD
jgi:hypothetical protein